MGAISSLAAVVTMAQVRSRGGRGGSAARRMGRATLPRVRRRPWAGRRAGGWRRGAFRLRDGAAIRRRRRQACPERFGQVGLNMQMRSIVDATARVRHVATRRFPLVRAKVDSRRQQNDSAQMGARSPWLRGAHEIVLLADR